MIRQLLVPLIVWMAVSLPAVAAVDYIHDIMPIFEAKCFDCHSLKAGKAKGNLEFDNLKDMEEFYIGKYTTMRPFNPDESLLLEFVTDPNSDDTMPPQGKGERLTPDELVKVRQWLTEGAIMDKTKQPEPPKTVPMAERPLLAWTNFEGKTLQAKFVRLNPDSVDLLLANGRSTRYPLDKLDEESQKQARELAQE